MNRIIKHPNASRKEVTSRFVCKPCEAKGKEVTHDVDPQACLAPYKCGQCGAEMTYVGGRIGGGSEKSRKKHRELSRL